MKKIILSVIILLCAVNSYGFRLQFGETSTITDTVRENLYISGGTVSINAPILGDLIIAGGTISVNDSVSGDILLAGGEATLNGAVGGDIRCAGGRLTINKNTYGELVVAGGEVIINRYATAKGMMVAGGNVTMDGTVYGDLKCTGGNITMGGEVAGDAEIKGGNITVDGKVFGNAVLAAQILVINDNAVFNNNVRYWTGKGEVDFKNSVKNGTAVFDPVLEIRRGDWKYLGLMTFMGLLWYIGMALLMIIIIQFLFKGAFIKAGNTINTQTWKSFGYGFLFFVAVPVSAILAFVTLIGFPLGLLLIFLYILALVLASVISALVITHYFNNRREKNWGNWAVIFIALGIFVILKLLSLIPFIGWLMMFIIACMAFGAILVSLKLKKTATVAG